MKTRSFIRLPPSQGIRRAADLTRLWMAKARASASRFPSRESTPTTVIATSTSGVKSRSVRSSNSKKIFSPKGETNEKQNCGIYRRFGLGSRRCDGLRRYEFPRLYAKPFDAWRYDDEKKKLGPGR